VRFGASTAAIDLPRGRARGRRKLAWALGYAVVVVLPLALVSQTPAAPGRSVVDELGSSLGIVALSLLGLQLVLPARLPLVSGGLGADLAVRLHRRLADVTFAVIAAHVAVVVLAEPARAAFLAFVGTPWPVQAAVVSTAALGALASSST